MQAESVRCGEGPPGAQAGTRRSPASLRFCRPCAPDGDLGPSSREILHAGTRQAKVRPLSVPTPGKLFPRHFRQPGIHPGRLRLMQQGALGMNI